MEGTTLPLISLHLPIPLKLLRVSIRRFGIRLFAFPASFDESSALRQAQERFFLYGPRGHEEPPSP